MGGEDSTTEYTVYQRDACTQCESEEMVLCAALLHLAPGQ